MDRGAPKPMNKVLIEISKQYDEVVAMPDRGKIKPLPLGKTIVYCLIPALILYTTHYYLIPGYVAFSGVPYFVGYLAGYVITMIFFFLAALVAYWKEGRPFDWVAIKARFRLSRMQLLDWFWTAVIIVFVLVTYFGLGFTGEWVREVPFLAPRETWPAEFGPGGVNNFTNGVFMGMPLKGQWWVVLVYFVGWFFNIFGEEFWFRGYILPRQELAFGGAAWVVNGLMFTINHLWQPWIMIAILPSVLFTVYIVQRRKNIWISIIQHGFVNIGLLFVLVDGVIG